MPIQAEKLRPDRNAFGSATVATRAMASLTNARYIVEPPASFTGSMPGHDQTIELQNLRLQRLQLGAESNDTGACNLGQPLVIGIGGNTEQLLDTIASDRRDDPKLCKMGANGVDHCGLLADKEMARTMEHQAALLLGVDRPTNRMFGLVTASQIASASTASFLCRFTYGFT